MAASSEGTAHASSYASVWRLWVPPSTPASAWMATRVRLFNGCCAVSDTPAVWVWKRIQVGALVLRPEALAGQLVPDAPRGPELGDLLEEVVVAVEEEAEPRREVVEAQAAGQRVLHVGDPVGDGEGQLLHRRRAGLADVVAGDADRVPARQLGGAPLDRVGHQLQRRGGREDVLLLGDELLEDVVLQRAGQLRARHAHLLGRGDVHGPDHGRGGVDGHGGADLADRQAVEQDLHVGQAGDGHAAGAELALRLGLVVVVAVEGGHVVGDRQAGPAGRRSAP